MSFMIYDDAVVNKIKLWCNNTELTVFGPSDTKRIFEVIADTQDDKPISLPFIAIRRKNTAKLNVNLKQPITYDGIMLESTENLSISANAIPMTLDYQIDIFTRYEMEADELLRNIVFNIINTPELHVEFMYNDTVIEHDSTFSLASELQDNSEIPERLIAGQFTRYTVDISVSNAFLWDIKTRQNYEVSPDIK